MHNELIQPYASPRRFQLKYPGNTPHDNAQADDGDGDVHGRVDLMKHSRQECNLV